MDTASLGPFDTQSVRSVVMLLLWKGYIQNKKA